MSKGRNQESKKLYDSTKLQGEDRYYVTWNISIVPAIRKYYDISAIELMLFLDICMNYDSNMQKPCKYSYQELADKYHCSKNGIINALKILTKKSLIEKTNANKGRAKSEYCPNVDHIQKLRREYLRSIQ